MTASDRPTVDVRAPNGGRIVLWPAMGTQRLPGLSRWSLAAVVTLAVVFLAASVTPLNHTDLWGHLYFGRWIVEHGRLPPSDPFRPGVGVEPFLNVPWLAQVLGYLAVNTLGLEGLVLGQAVLVTLSAAGVMLAVRGRGVPAGWATAAAAASYLLALPVEGTIRPQLFGVVAFSATLWAAARLPVRRHPLLWLPPLFALWANVHGSFPMGLAVLACLAVSETWEARAAHRTLLAACREKAVRRAWLALVASVAGACLNPCGPYLLLAVAGFAGNGNLEGISEWRPMVLGSLSGVLFFGSLLVTALLLRLSPRRISLLEILLFLLLATASLSAIRMMAWWAIVWPWIVAPHAAAVWLLYRRTRPAEAPGARPDRRAAFARLLAAAGVVLLALWWSPGTFALLAGRPRAEKSILSPDTPIALADAMVSQRLHGRFVAPIDWADYLVWRTGGSVEPLVHTHVHLITPTVWGDFLHIRAGSPDWLEIADRYRLRYVVVRFAENRELFGRAMRSPRCRLVYKDSRSAVLEIIPPPL